MAMMQPTLSKRRPWWVAFKPNIHFRVSWHTSRTRTPRCKMPRPWPPGKMAEELWKHKWAEHGRWLFHFMPTPVRGQSHLVAWFLQAKYKNCGVGPIPLDTEPPYMRDVAVALGVPMDGAQWVPTPGDPNSRILRW